MIAREHQTECPHCTAVLAVDETLLRAKDPRVRCGHCLAVFNARENLLTDATRYQGSDEDSPTLAISPTLQDRDIDPFDQAIDDPVFASKQSSIHAKNEITTTSARLGSNATKLSQSDPSSHETAAPRFSVSPSSTPVPAALPSFSSHQNAVNTVIHNPNPTQAASAETPTPPTENRPHRAQKPEAIQAHSDPRTHNRSGPNSGPGQPSKSRLLLAYVRNNIPLVIVSVVLLIASLLTLGLVFHQSLALTSLRPLAAISCSIGGCDLPPRVDDKAFALTRHRMYSHSERKNALMISLQFKNNAEFAQPLPVLKINLRADDGSIVARGSFGPERYFNNYYSQYRLPPNTPIEATLLIQDPGGAAIGYEVEFSAQTQ